jgi:hypothetical protein
MARRIVDRDGATWSVTLSGRHTQYARDELSVEFQRQGDGERRFARFSPRGSKSPERAMEQASDALLGRLLAASQPAWTSPDGGYGAG